ncbi:MAG: hypothetical protein RL235_447 [Chlamydiota bacterium]
MGNGLGGFFRFSIWSEQLFWDHLLELEAALGQEGAKRVKATLEVTPDLSETGARDALTLGSQLFPDRARSEADDGLFLEHLYVRPGYAKLRLEEHGRVTLQSCRLEGV